jgi:hypothetical protein
MVEKRNDGTKLGVSLQQRECVAQLGERPVEVIYSEQQVRGKVSE